MKGCDNTLSFFFSLWRYDEEGSSEGRYTISTKGELDGGYTNEKMNFESINL